MSTADDLQRARALAVEVLGTTEAATAWLRTPQSALGEITPTAAIEAGRIDDVLNVLNAVGDGGYL